MRKLDRWRKIADDPFWIGVLAGMPLESKHKFPTEKVP
jgi:hypothetical protein